MDIFHYIIISLILSCIAIVLWIPVMVYKWIKKLRAKGQGRKANIISIVCCTLIVLICYAFVGAVFPYDSFYKDEFEQYLGMSFPEDARIVHKDAMYPDFHGKYVSTFAMELTPESYKKLLASCPQNSSYCSGGLMSVMQYYDTQQAIQTFSKTDGAGAVRVMFMADHKTVIFVLGFGMSPC